MIFWIVIKSKTPNLVPFPFLVVVVYEQSWPLNNQGTTTLCPATQPFTPLSMDCCWVTQDHTFFSSRFSNFQNHLIYIGLGGALDWGKWIKNSPQWKFDTNSERFLTESSGSIISPPKNVRNSTPQCCNVPTLFYHICIEINLFACKCVLLKWKQREQFLFWIAPLCKSNNMQVDTVQLKWNFRDVRKICPYIFEVRLRH